MKCFTVSNQKVYKGLSVVELGIWPEGTLYFSIADNVFLPQPKLCRFKRDSFHPPFGPTPTSVILNADYFQFQGQGEDDISHVYNTILYAEQKKSPNSLILWVNKYGDDYTTNVNHDGVNIIEDIADSQGNTLYLFEMEPASFVEITTNHHTSTLRWDGTNLNLSETTRQ